MTTLDFRSAFRFDTTCLLTRHAPTVPFLALPTVVLDSPRTPPFDPRPKNAVKGAATLLTLEDVQEDINRMITSIAFKYTDQSCIFLHTDEIEAELRAKFSKALPVAMKKAGQSRAKFFAFAATVLKNHARSLVQKHRFTQKRTGIKPPPKDERFAADFHSYKPCEISLDDPETHLQVSSEPAESDNAVNELVQDILEHCDDLHQIVFKQLTAPNLTALKLAELDSRRGAKPNHRITITRQHMADGIGVPLELFEKTVLSLQDITLRVREMNTDNLAAETALATLCRIFGLQLPKSAPPLVVRRCLTLAARDNWQKVNSEVEDLLEKVGAKAPKFNGTNMSCFGVLYQQGNRICSACGLNQSCKVQAENIGLGEITLSPKLLGAKLNRTPYLLPNADKNSPPPAANERDMEIIEYLFANFQRVTYKGELCFRPKDFEAKQKLIFCTGTSTVPLNLKFCSPSAELKKELDARGGHYYAPPDMPSEDVIALIDAHTKNAYEPISTP